MQMAITIQWTQRRVISLKRVLIINAQKILKMALLLKPMGYPKSSQAMNHNLSKIIFIITKRLVDSTRAQLTPTLTSSLSFINMPILAYSSEIQSPVLIIHGDKAHSKYFSQDAYKKLKGKNKELLLIKDANHTDLYDNAQKIPFDKIEAFFSANLK